MKYLDALNSQRAVTRLLLAMIFVVAGMGVGGFWFAWRTPKVINVHVLPNITADSTVLVKDGDSEVPPQNVYSFAYYIWQQINHWTTDGSVDYGRQIFMTQYFITPQCRAKLEEDIEARQKAGELRLRTRTVTEIPGLGYARNRVVDEGGNHTSWTVFLDTQVQETFRGMPVKDVYIRYPIRVVRYDVDRERNPWQLAIDCYGTNVPERLTEADLHPRQADGRPAPPGSPVTAPALPGQIAPSVLPQTEPIKENGSAPTDAGAASAPASEASQ